jgi:undecaprenyl-diphosphatase
MRRLPALFAALFLSLLFAAIAVMVGVGWSSEQRWDMAVESDAHDFVLSHRWLFDVARAVTHLGDQIPVTVACVILAVVLWLQARRRAALYVLVVRAVTALAGAAIKHAVGRDRPVLDHPLASAAGHSFPSGHALGSAALWASLAIVVTAALPFAARILLATLVPIIVAASRVLIGVHYVTDVVAGLALGWTCALVLGLTFLDWSGVVHRPFTGRS